MECQCKTALTARNFGKPGGLALRQELDEFAERAGERGEFLEIRGREVGPRGRARFPFAADLDDANDCCPACSCLLRSF